MINIEDTIEPIQENVIIYDKYYEIYKDLYRSLKDHYIQIAKIEGSLFHD